MVLVCDGGVGAKDMLAIIGKLWWTGRGEEMEVKREAEETTEAGLQWRVRLERSMALIASW